MRQYSFVRMPTAWLLAIPLALAIYGCSVNASDTGAGGAAISLKHQAALRASLKAAGTNRDSLVKALEMLPAGQRPGMKYLLENMPRSDLQKLTGAFLANDVSQSYAAMKAAPWRKEVPRAIFFQYVLPYANLDEIRESWRTRLAALCRPLVAHCRTATQAALVLNKAVFPLLNVRYSADKRPKPNQSPSESIAAHYASCSGLSILLVDACRSVGVPARIVGTPMWAIHRGDANGNNAGNHTWVEFWDGQWHILGASEVSPPDKTWFLANASLAYGARNILIDGIYAHRIYAATFKRNAGKNGDWFPMVWNLQDRTVYAEDVTSDYFHRVRVKVRLVNSHNMPTTANLILRRKGRLIADLPVDGKSVLWLSAGGHYSATMRLKGKKWQQAIVIPSVPPFQVVVTLH